MKEKSVETLPLGWKRVRLGEIITSIQNGFACGERDDKGIIQLRMNNLDTNGNMIMEQYIRVPKHYYSPEFELKKNDILFNHTNSAELVGKTILFDKYEEPLTFSNHFSRIRINEKIAMPEFITLYIIKLWNSKYFEYNCDRWIGQAAFQPKKMVEIEIPLPPLDEQKLIAESIEKKLRAVEKVKNAVKDE
jgi:type I restriction enzyme S subunit